jgi:hypothetical protein
MRKRHLTDGIGKGIAGIALMSIVFTQGSLTISHPFQQPITAVAIGLLLCGGDIDAA